MLTFYTERLAKESYLRTARERISLQELGRLIGYRLRPGVAAETHLAFALEPPPDVPAAATRDPGSAPPVTPSAVTLEPGLRVQSIPGPGEQPQTFETVEEIEARPEWNAIAGVDRRCRSSPALGDTHAYLQGVGAQPEARRRVPARRRRRRSHERWDLRIAHARRRRRRRRADARRRGPSRSARSTPHVRPPTRPQAVRAAQADRRLRPQRAAVEGDVARRSATTTRTAPRDAGDWPDFTISSPPGDRLRRPRRLAPGRRRRLVGRALEPTLPRAVAGRHGAPSSSRAEFAISGKVTRLKLDGRRELRLLRRRACATTTVFAVSEPLDARRGAGRRADVAAATIDGRRRRRRRCGPAAGCSSAARRRRARSTPRRSCSSEVQAVGGELAARARRTTSRPRTSATRSSCTATSRSATHGETVQQLLGSGRARDAVPALHARARPAHLPAVDADPSGADADARGARQRRALGRGADALRRRAARPRLRRAHRRGGRDLRAVRRRRARRAAADRARTTCARRYRKGLGAAGNVGAGRARAAARPAARRQGREQPGRGRRRRRPGAGGGRARVDPARRAHARPRGLAARLRGLRARVRRRRQGARRGAAAARRPRRSSSPSRSRLPERAAERLDDLADDAARRTATRTSRSSVLAGTRRRRSGSRSRSRSTRPTRPTRCSPAVEAALRAAYSFDARGFGAAGAPLGGRSRSRTRCRASLAVDLDRLYTGTTPGLADRLLAQQPAVGAGGTRDRRPACSCSTRRRSTGWRR